jgi:hypothetical protein
VIKPVTETRSRFFSEGRGGDEVANPRGVGAARALASAGRETGSPLGNTLWRRYAFIQVRGWRSAREEEPGSRFYGGERESLRGEKAKRVRRV